MHLGLVLALSAGFGVAVLLAAQLAIGTRWGHLWPVLVQVHGHAQVMGWMGLFIMGVSLYFLPRLAGAPLRSHRVAQVSAALLGGGIAARSVAQICLFDAQLHWRPVLIVASLAQVLGVCLYVGLILHCLATADPSRRPVRALRICFASMLVGWLSSTALITWQSLDAASQSGFLHPGWNRLGLDLFVGLVLLPVAFAFAIRTFPLYLRLPAVRWSIGGLVGLYLTGFALQVGPEICTLGAGIGSQLPAGLPLVGAAGSLVKGGAILAFVWRLDLLTRRQPAWIVEREGSPPAQPQHHAKPRPHLPDYGEFGHFEWHVYTAFAFLVIGGVLEAHAGLGLLFGIWMPVAGDTLRHIYLLGFGTLLLLGMAPRMLPGFWGLRRPASARLIDLSFGLAASATVLRLLPGLLPTGPGSDAAQLGLGLSGLLGWLAVVALAVNLWWTRWQVPAWSSEAAQRNTNPDTEPRRMDHLRDPQAAQ